MTDRAEIETLSSRVAYENRWTLVREDRIRRADGSDGIYRVVVHPDFRGDRAGRAGRVDPSASNTAISIKDAKTIAALSLMDITRRLAGDR